MFYWRLDFEFRPFWFINVCFWGVLLSYCHWEKFCCHESLWNTNRWKQRNGCSWHFAVFYLNCNVAILYSVCLFPPFAHLPLPEVTLRSYFIEVSQKIESLISNNVLLTVKMFVFFLYVWLLTKTQLENCLFDWVEWKDGIF